MLFGMAAFADSDTFIMSGGTGIAHENQALPQQTLAYNTTSKSWSPIDTSLFVQTYVYMTMIKVQRRCHGDVRARAHHLFL